MGLLIDTTFWIDLQKERRAGIGGPVRQWLASPRSELFVSVVTLSEYLVGFDQSEWTEARKPLEDVTLLPVTDAIAERVAVLARMLRQRGQMIGSNDLWIGATALEFDLVVLTRNLEHFPAPSRSEARDLLSRDSPN